MIDINIHNDLLILLRASLLILPVMSVLFLAKKYKNEERVLVGSFFSFLYGIALLLPAHALAINLGMWQYGSETLLILGMPADLWFAGSLLFGPTIFLTFPKLSPLVFTTAFIVIQALVFKSLDPFVIAGDNWFLGIVIVFLLVHIPALYLANWTAYDINLPIRAALLAFAYGFLAFFVLPTIIMQAMGGSWSLEQRSILSITLTLLCLFPCTLMGLSAVHMFVVHGEGTPIPLDKTKHLVKSGLYSYITNPMQLCTAISWVIIGIFLENVFVALAAVMAVIFVMGLVRWHHRNDLLVRFPKGWPEYKANVPEWLPRWKPWVKEESKLYWNPKSAMQRTYIKWLKKRSYVGLLILENDFSGAQYEDSTRGLTFNSSAAFIYPLFHINFIYALFASGLLLALLPKNWFQASGISKGSRLENDAS